METQHTEASSKEYILKAFRELLSKYRQTTSKIRTKQETADREADKQIVEMASKYTVESIVKGLADLQLDFGKSTADLVAKLAVEAPKLEELRRAIRVETQHLEELRHIRIVADALDILIQEHQEKTEVFEQQSRQTRQTLDQEIVETKQSWQKEQQEFESALQERWEFVKKERQQKEADYQYELERTRKMEADEYAARKIALERQIAEENLKRETDWIEREKVLTDQKEILERYRALAASCPKELEEATEKARQRAMDEVCEEAKVQAELFEKEHAASKKVYALQVVSLQETINRQANQIEQLSTQLQVALKQGQGLAARAIAGKIETRA